jgi:hypothetical protein
MTARLRIVVTVLVAAAAPVLLGVAVYLGAAALASAADEDAHATLVTSILRASSIP